MNGRYVKEDARSRIAEDDGNYATIEEIKNPEDVFNRAELCLIFSATPVNQTADSFVGEFQ